VQAQIERPKVVVVIVVDQMRADFLTRFDSLYEGGLALLSREGGVYSQAYHDHFFTSTAAGHATISTGVYPSRSGIVANSWWDRAERANVYAVDDPDSPIVGRPSLDGRSPDNMLRDALGDWVKRDSPESKVYAVTLKDRSAITLGGRRPDDAYWYDTETGRFITSTYYQDSTPKWVHEFNEDALVDTYYSKMWTRLLPEEAYSASREDGFEAESDGVHITFPHKASVLVDSTEWRATEDNGYLARYPAVYYDELKRTPFADEVTFAFAERLMVNEELGKDDVPDLLFVGATAADYIGHRYGPMSQEIEDYYLRLDRMVDDFMGFLDKTVGEGRYVVVLTSDHGVVTMPEELIRRGVDALRIDRLARQEIIIPPLTKVLGDMDLIDQLRGVLVSPYGLVMRLRSDVREFIAVRARRGVAAELRESPYVADAVAYDDVRESSDDEFRRLLLRSFHPNRAPDIVIRYKEHYLYRMEAGGTTHETPYSYDSHVPLIFWGPGISPGWHDRRVRTVDIAPTIAALLGVEPPDDLDGVRLDEIVR
jgi:predicted AlkP superfamily pyrophosphatase or phosphodiesterase